jgi:hypothetical protein
VHFRRNQIFQVLCDVRVLAFAPIEPTIFDYTCSVLRALCHPHTPWSITLAVQQLQQAQPDWQAVTAALTACAKAKSQLLQFHV